MIFNKFLLKVCYKENILQYFFLLFNHDPCKCELTGNFKLAQNIFFILIYMIVVVIVTTTILTMKMMKISDN